MLHEQAEKLLKARASVRINHITSTDDGAGFVRLVENDPELAGLLREHVGAVSEDAHLTAAYVFQRQVEAK